LSNESIQDKRTLAKVIQWSVCSSSIPNTSHQLKQKLELWLQTRYSLGWQKTDQSIALRLLKPKLGPPTATWGRITSVHKAHRYCRVSVSVSKNNFSFFRKFPAELGSSLGAKVLLTQFLQPLPIGCPSFSFRSGPPKPGVDRGLSNSLLESSTFKP
jgi:hypothetical protein